MTTLSNSNQQLISEIISQKDVNRFGFTQLERPLTMDFYLNWLATSHHGEMEYLRDHSEKKANPQLLLPKANSAIVLAFQYLPHPYPLRETPLRSVKTALYSRGKDYHHWVGRILADLCAEFKKRFPNDEFVGFVDSSPVLERDLARRAGLGWVGKNTCLIDSKSGSLFFISEIYTTMNLGKSEKLQPDHCGTCRKCIDVCPTGALSERNLDARKCISYLTIESKSVPAVELRKPIGDWLFGCDLCQSVCPWNIKFFKNEIFLESQTAPRDEIINDLHLILSSSNKRLSKMFQDTSLSRASGNKLKRNAMIVVANKKLVELRNQVTNYLTNPYFTELCNWTLSELDAP